MTLSKTARPLELLSDSLLEIEARESPRFGCHGPPQLKIMVRPSFVPLLTGIRDISTKGIGLSCDRLIPPGASLAVLWDYGLPDRWRTLRARVSRASAFRRGGWVIGCTFLERLDLCDVDAFMRSGQHTARHRRG